MKDYKLRLTTLLLLGIAYLLCPSSVVGKEATDSILSRLYSYRSSIGSSIEGYTTTVYMKIDLKTDRRNITLLCVPHLYPLARSHKRSHVGEAYATMTFHEEKECETKMHAMNNTLRRNRTMLPSIMGYLTPSIYQPTLFSDHLISPFHRSNKKYYRYKTIMLTDSLVWLEYKPNIRNTQTVRGYAILEKASGRVCSCLIIGEYDMVSFEINITMGREGVESLIPSECQMKAKCSFFGNRLRSVHHAIYNLPPHPPTSSTPKEILDSIRPFPLTDTEARIFAESDSIRQARQDTSRVKKYNFAKDILWDKIGDKIFDRQRGRFGSHKQGYYRLSPLISPLNLSYSKRRGVTYRLKANFEYEFGPKSDFSARCKLGYSFLLKQAYIDMPLTYTFYKPNNGYVRLQWKGGDRVTNSTVLDKLKAEHGDTIDWDSMDLDYFHHNRLSLMGHYDINQYISFESGLSFNFWSSVHDKDFTALGKPTHYNNSTLTEELTVRPLGWKGPVITLDYERTLRGPSDKGMNYEKWEIDCSYIHYIPGLRSWSLRLGSGFYSTQTSNAYFLDYNNFRENNIPNGWNDDWSGEFELLHRNWYNSSRYYIRANATYESPLLLLSRLPLIGTVIERERIYIGALNLSQLKNYMELGYSMTNRVVTLGMFSSFVEGKFDAFGVRVGFELFDDW